MIDLLDSWVTKTGAREVSIGYDTGGISIRLFKNDYAPPLAGGYGKTLCEAIANIKTQADNLRAVGI